MKKSMLSVLIGLLMGALLAACGPSQAERDAQATQIAAIIFATQTAQAPTATLTPSPTPSATPTFTPTPTSTQTPTKTPTATPSPMPTKPPTATPSATPTAPPRPTVAAYSLPAGWHDYSVSDFYIALPERWKAVDVDKEGIKAVQDELKALNTEWAQNASKTLTTEGMQEMIKFWAIDSKPAGFGHALVSVAYQSLPFSVTAEDLSAQLGEVVQQMGAELVSTKSGLVINGLDAARLTVRLPLGSMSVKEYVYVYVQGRRMWAITFAVDEQKWSEYEPVFATAAESFRVGGLAKAFGATGGGLKAGL